MGGLVLMPALARVMVVMVVMVVGKGKGKGKGEGRVQWGRNEVMK